MPLLGLAILLFGAKLGGVIFKKLKQPSVAGELLAGVVLGPAVFGLVEKTSLIDAMAELGLIFLVLLISMTVDWRKLENRAETLGWIELFRAVLTFGAVFLIGSYLGWDFYTKIVVSMITLLTSTAVVSRTLVDLNEIKSSVGETILSINVVGDIVSIVTITILAGFISTSTINIEPVFTLILLLIGFFVVMGRVGGRLVNKVTTVIQKYGIEDMLLAFTLMIAFLFGAMTEGLKLASLLGVFFAGMLLSKSGQYATASKKVKEVGEGFFIPLFFGSVGLAFSFAAVYSQIYFIMAFIAVLMGVKWICSIVTFRAFRFSTEDSVKIGSGLISLSEMTVVMAAMAFQTVNPPLFTMLIVLFIVMNIIAPFVTTFTFKHNLGSSSRSYSRAVKETMYNFKKD
jgi:Kef-type K+ transport system membrane component KefB